MLGREDVIWAAGFFVGEGSTSLSRGTNGQSAKVYTKIHLSAPQNYREPLDRMAATLGGKVYGPYARKSTDGDYYQWRLNGHEGVQAAIAAMWRWLDQPKRQQATKALVSYRDIHA